MSNHSFCQIFQVIRRSSEEEKFLVVTKYRIGHSCANSWIVISLVAWEGVKAGLADQAYDNLSYKLGNFGIATHRR